MADDRDTKSGSRTNQSGSQRELKDAIDRLEKAVEDLAGTAKDEWADWADRATAFIDETSSRLEREVTSRKERAHRKAKEQPVVANPPETVRDRLMRDSSRGKIAGVCAGVARSWNMEVWMVRCMAITGLLFFPGVMVPAYLIAWAVLSDSAEPGRRRSRKRRRHEPEPVAAASKTPRQPEKPLAPRTQYKNVQSVLSQAELRLRRMETHVTSGQYDLQKELHALDDEPVAKPVT